MSVRTKKLIGAIGIGTLVAGALISLYGAILYYVNAKADTTDVKVSSLSADVSAIKQDTSWLKSWACSISKTQNCPIPR